MRHLLTLLLVLVVLSLTISAQTTDITSISGSVLGVQEILPDEDMEENSNVSLRLGLMAELSYNSSTILYGRAMWQSPETGLVQYFLDKNYGPLTLRFGRFGTPTAFLHRPHQFLSAGHFEPPSLGEISHSDHGVLAIGYTDIGKFYSGVYYNDSRKKAETHVSWSSNTNSWCQKSTAPITVNLSAYTAGEGVYGGAFSFVTDYKNTPNVVVGGYVETDSTASFFLEPNFGIWGAPFLDMVYNLNQKRTNWEIGLTKKIADTKKWNGVQGKVLIGLGYRENRITVERTFRALSLFFWIHS